MTAPPSIRVTALAVTMVGVTLAGCDPSPGCVPSAGKVSPHGCDYWLPAPRVRSLDVRVDLEQAPPSREPLDVALVFDATASMEHLIGTVTAAAREIVSEVRGLSEDARFAVASFDDYFEPCGPWHLHQDLTPDAGLVAAGLGRIRVANGHDIPEAYSRALHEAASLSWREGSARFLVLFGDAPARDPSFYGVGTGIDLGPDGVEGTGDDLRLGAVVEALRAKGIRILAVHDRKPMWGRQKPLLDEAIRGFRFMAERTGGLTRPIDSAADAAEAIRSGLRDAYRPTPILVPAPGYEGWVTIGAPRDQDGGHRRFVFPVELHPPEGAAGAVHRFPLRATYDAAAGGGEIGRTHLLLRTGWLAYPWYRWVLPAALATVAALLLLWFALRATDVLRTARYTENGQTAAAAWALARPLLLATLFWWAWRSAPGRMEIVPQAATAAEPAAPGEAGTAAGSR